MKPLTMAYFRTARCMTPGCTVDHSGEGLWLHQGCHPKQGEILELKDHVLHITCAVCFRPVADIAVIEDKPPVATVLRSGEIKNTCHRSAPLFIYGEKGKAQIHCARCEKLIDSLTIAEEESPATKQQEPHGRSHNDPSRNPSSNPLTGPSDSSR